MTNLHESEMVRLQWGALEDSVQYKEGAEPECRLRAGEGMRQLRQGTVGT